MKIEIIYDKKADVLYLCFSGERVAYAKQLDAERSVDYSEQGEIIGFKFRSATSGVSTEGLPYKSAIERALRNNGFVQPAPQSGAKPDEALSSEQKKARIATVLWTGFAILIFLGSLAASAILARSLFVLESLPGLVAALFGLVVALIPAVSGGIVLWLIVGCALQKKSSTSGKFLPGKGRVKRVKAEQQPLD